ncbi:hypothetical protein COD05_01675 [Bacillus cereus]|nr:hypothetical protein CN431_26810 [Bacillus cereus]PFW53548.1 hypothetical protein COL27_35025 [Bacillus sp. AFS075960]RFB50477.1 hypothetical protein DZB83_03920 [Bacillus sp. dmp10]RFB77463.1 hypothetical protein DZB94_03855 [Bacillus sp. AW]PFI50398.1 hypothetical protein COI76_21660 [Bacillus cereus]
MCIHCFEEIIAIFLSHINGQADWCALIKVSLYAYSTSNDIENRRSDTSEKKLTLFRKGYFMRFVTYR